jgi:hypothetical protein
MFIGERTFKVLAGDRLAYLRILTYGSYTLIERNNGYRAARTAGLHTDSFSRWSLTRHQALPK